MPFENPIQQFTNNSLGVSIRVVDRNGEPWFVARDVALALGYVRTADAVREHCKGVGEMETPSTGGNQVMKIIPEADLYRLILKSKLPQAEAFQDWVVEVVLPSIRKHGAYMTDSVLEQVMNSPEAILSMAEALVTERDRRQLAEERLSVFKPRTRFGTPSRFNGLPRTQPASGYFRTTKTTTTITETTEHQRRLFDFDEHDQEGDNPEEMSPVLAT